MDHSKHLETGSSVPKEVATPAGANPSASGYQRWGDEDAVFRQLFDECKSVTAFGPTDPGSDKPNSVTVDARFCDGTEAIDLGKASITYRGEVITLDDNNLIGAFGGAQTAKITGNDANNDIRAGSGGSEMSGGKGFDFLVGGAGIDHFSYANLDHSNLTDGYDSIYDFECGKDKITIGGRGWYPIDDDEPINHHSLKSELMDIQSRGEGWWQVTIPSNSAGNPNFYLMVQTECPHGGLTVDDFLIV